MSPEHAAAQCSRRSCEGNSLPAEERINILLTEACATYGDRAHWDAICDLQFHSRELGAVNDRDEHIVALRATIARLNDLLEIYSKKLEPTAFLADNEWFARFDFIAGLNDAAFNCNLFHACSVALASGGITLPPSIRNYVVNSCQRGTTSLPKYALITGNTEQRYLRLYFVNNVDGYFSAAIENQSAGFAGEGVGILARLLESLPSEIDIVKLSNFLVEKTPDGERGRIEITGHWPESPQEGDTMRGMIEALQISDIEGRPHGQIFKLLSFERPERLFPRVFISYSIGCESGLLTQLRNALASGGYEPVLGTAYRTRSSDSSEHGRDVVEDAFAPIPTCVAFVSLLVAREDLRTVDGEYMSAPWTIAEEVFAWSKRIGPIFRIRERSVTPPAYNRNLRDIPFDLERSVGAINGAPTNRPAPFGSAITQLLDALAEFQRSEEFERSQDRARSALLRESTRALRSKID